MYRGSGVNPSLFFINKIMKRKIYETLGKRAKLSVPITLGEKTIRVEFSNGGLLAAGQGRYITCDEQIQQALESSNLFKKIYILKDSLELNPKSIEPKNTQVSQETVELQAENDALQFANFNELRDYLINNHNCAASSVRSMTLAMKEAQKLGLNVEISK